MKKFLVRFALLFIILVACSKALINLSAYQAIETFKEKTADSFALTYEWVGSNLAGEIIYEDLTITPYALKRTVSVEDLRLDYGSYFALLRNTLSLGVASSKGIQRASFDGISGALEGRDIEQWLASEFRAEFGTPLGLYACGRNAAIDHAALRAMGIEQLSGNLSLELKEPELKESWRIAFSGDFGAFGVYEGVLAISGSGQSKEPSDEVSFSDYLGSMILTELTIKHIEGGYFRRLSNFCQQSTNLEREAFAVSAAMAWQETMASNGIRVNKALVDVYEKYLGLGGALTLNVRPASSESLNEYFTSYDQNLMEVLSASLELNGEVQENLQLVLISRHFDPPPEPEKVEQPERNPALDQPVYQIIELADIDSVLGRWLKVSLKDGKVLEGDLLTSDEFHFELNRLLDGGKVAFKIKREDVETVELRTRNDQ